jgi:hypothetical protein
MLQTPQLAASGYQPVGCADGHLFTSPGIVPDFDDDAAAAPFGNPNFYHAADR